MHTTDVLPNPCTSCPYRCDTPPGVWHPDEYRKLPAYDDDPATVYAVFLCHHSPTQTRDTICRGWLAVHPDHVATRLAIAMGILPAPPWPDTTVEVYESSTEAANAGLIDGPPSPAALATQVEVLTRRHTRPRRTT